MDFIADYTDLGAPEIPVTGCASIERVSSGQVRVTYYSQRKDGAVAVAHILWDLQAWLRHWPVYEEARELIDRMPPPNGAEDRKRERH